MHVSEIGAPHLVDPEPARAERAPALRGRLRPALGRRSPRYRRETSGSSATACSTSRPSRRPVMPRTTSPSWRRTAPATRAMPRACESRPARYVAPVAPPPDIDVEAWERTLDAIEERRPDAAPPRPLRDRRRSRAAHLVELRAALRTWAERARDGSEEEFVARGGGRRRRRRPIRTTAELFQQAGPFWQSYAGLRRYWDKKEEAAAA